MSSPAGENIDKRSVSEDEAKTEVLFGENAGYHYVDVSRRPCLFAKVHPLPERMSQLAIYRRVTRRRQISPGISPSRLRYRAIRSIEGSRRKGRLPLPIPRPLLACPSNRSHPLPRSEDRTKDSVCRSARNLSQVLVEFRVCLSAHRMIRT